MSVESWGIFATLALIATLSPGPAIFLVVTHSLTYGVRRALATICGNVTGLLLMASLAMFGVGAVLSYSTDIFLFLRYIGAAYLIVLGVKLWRNGFALETQAMRKGRTQKNWLHFYVRGLLVALSNPKAIAFSTALFPQFIDPKQAVLPQFGLLMATFMCLSFVCLLGYALLFRFGQYRLGAHRFFDGLSKAFAALLAAAGLALAGGHFISGNRS